MTSHPFRISAYRKYLSVLLLLAVGFISHSQDTTLTVISNIKGAPSEMKFSELRSVLMGERQRWNDGTKVTIVLMKTSTPIGKSTCEKVYQKSGDRVNLLWRKLVFEGKADPPKFCNSEAELLSAIAENSGTIGIIGKFSDTPNIKVVSINGKKTL